MRSKKTVTYKCPYCEKRFTRENLVNHIEEEHYDLIPKGFTPFRLVFNYVNKKSLDYHGKCTECGGPTPWDENKGRYNRQCNNPRCKASYIKKFEDNMIRVKGITRISMTPEGQEKMLSKRKISGKYKFQNGVEKTYTGKYELNALKFMDEVMNISPDDILCPGPILEYTYEGKTHIYITDFYYQPYNLIIEVKDGGKNPNNRNMPEYRAKQIAKEEYIIKHTDFNYLRLTDNDLSQLLAVMMDLKMQMVENTGERVIHVNEAIYGIDKLERKLIFDDMEDYTDNLNDFSNYLLKEDTDRMGKYFNIVQNISDEYNIQLYARGNIDNRDGSFYQKFLPIDNVSNNYDIENIINENTYVVADLHFGKEKSEDNNTISFLNKIPNSSTLLILGDIEYIKKPDLEYLRKCFSKIKCKNIFLVLGNHDCYSLDYYYSLGIKGIYEKIFIKNNKWIFSHQPCDGPSTKWTNFHGHIHEKTVYLQVKDIKNKINCFYKYFDKPLKIKELLEWNKTNNLEKSIISESNIIIYEDFFEYDQSYSKQFKDISEAMNALMTGYIPGMKDTGNVYIVNYMRNNVFSGEEERGYGISDNCKLTNLICRNKEGILDKASDNFLENAKYNVYLVKDMSKEKVSELLSEHMGTFVEEGFVYETLFGKKMYTYDQIETESNAIPVIDYYKGMEVFSEMVNNYITGKKRSLNHVITNENSIISIDISESDKGCVCYMSLLDGTYRLESVEFPELFIESDHYMGKDSIENKLLESILMEVK